MDDHARPGGKRLLRPRPRSAPTASVPRQRHVLERRAAATWRLLVGGARLAGADHPRRLHADALGCRSRPGGVRGLLRLAQPRWQPPAPALPATREVAARVVPAPSRLP